MECPPEVQAQTQVDSAAAPRQGVGTWNAPPELALTVNAAEFDFHLRELTPTHRAILLGEVAWNVIT
jgi:hypothetical protein